jgi:hypothetical protein
MISSLIIVDVAVADGSLVDVAVAVAAKVLVGAGLSGTGVD